MEALGGAASIVAILQLAGAVVERGFWLYQQIHDAPEELAAAQECLILLRSELVAISGLDPFESGAESTFDANTIQGLRSALTTAESAMKLAAAELEQFPAKLRVGGRIKWALLDQRRSQRIQRHIKSTESSVTTVLVLLLVRNQNAQYADLRAMIAANSMQSLSSTEALSVVPHLPHPERIQRRTSLRPRGLQSTARALISATAIGLRATLVQLQWVNATTWSLSIDQSLPFAKIQVRLHLHTNSMGRSLQLANGSGIALARSVENDNALITACRLGDVESARRLLGSRECFVTDTTFEPAWPPIAYAIESGSLELVSLLIDCGAGVDWTFGKNQTSPLQLALWNRQDDIARLLLRKGANTGYRSALGFDLPYYAWATGRKTHDLELTLKMLYSEDGLDELNDLDIHGWTCLHHVAVYGTAREAEILLRLGADPSILSEPLGWTALQHSVYYDNWKVFSVLKRQFAPGTKLSQLVDRRGWNLLHMAAGTGTRALVEDVLSLSDGGDLNALTEEATELLIPALFRKRCSPADIAAIGGVADSFFEAVESYYISRGLVARHGDNQEIEVFHDAE